MPTFGKRESAVAKTSVAGKIKGQTKTEQRKSVIADVRGKKQVNTMAKVAKDSEKIVGHVKAYFAKAKVVGVKKDIINALDKSFTNSIKKMSKGFVDDIDLVLDGISVKDVENPIMLNLLKNMKEMRDINERIADDNNEVSKDEYDRFLELNKNSKDLAERLKESENITKKTKDAIELLEHKTGKNFDELVSINDEMKEVAEKQNMKVEEFQAKISDNIEKISTSPIVDDVFNMFGQALGGPFFILGKQILGINSALDAIKFPKKVIDGISNTAIMAKTYISEKGQRAKEFMVRARSWILEKIFRKKMQKEEDKENKENTQAIVNAVSKVEAKGAEGKDNGDGIWALIFGGLALKFRKLIKPIKAIVKILGKSPKLLIGGLMTAVAFIGKSAISLLTNTGKFATGIWDNIILMGSKAVEAIVKFGSTIWDKIISVIPKPLKKILGLAGKEGAEKGAKKAVAKVATKGVAKAGTKVATKVGAKFLAKIPGFGLLVAAGLTASKLMEGDVKGAALEALSGVIAQVPLVGLPASLAVDAYTIKRDFDRAKDEPIIAKTKSMKEQAVVKTESIEQPIQTIKEKEPQLTAEELQIQVAKAMGKAMVNQYPQVAQGGVISDMDDLDNIPSVFGDLGLLVVNTGKG